MGFLTIEDVNTNNLSIINEFYELDTSLLGDEDYSNKIYDFVKVNRSTASNTITFDFKIVNSLWTGGFYVTDSTGEYIDVSEDYTYDSTNNILSITADDDIIIHFYLCDFNTTFKLEQICVTFDEYPIVEKTFSHMFNVKIVVNDLIGAGPLGFDVSLVDSEGNITYYDFVEFTDYHGGAVEPGELMYFDLTVSNVSDVVAIIAYNPSDDFENCLYLKVLHKKIKPTISLMSIPVYLGQVNKVKLNMFASYVGLEGEVLFNNSVSTIYVENNEYCFDLDLRDYNKRHVELKLVLFENSNVLGAEFNFSFNVDYKLIVTESEFLNCISNGESIINLNNDIILTNDIIVTASVKIIGNDNSIDLNSHSIILNEGLNFKAENLRLNNGDTAIIQGRNTKLELDNVIFSNCISSKYNNQGACILCNIDINSLDSADDYITVLNNCTFVNNHNCIVHGGELSVTDCKYLNNDITYTDKNNVAFLYQIDGNANISNCIFDINYTSDVYCSNEENIGFAQALLKIGETAQINTDSHKNYTDNISTFTNNNQCHLFVKYYYDKIESCVYSSPEAGKENKAFCYSASGVNWVFKENIKVTRASNSNENTNQPFDWE